MPYVQVPREFFEGELRVYSDWREAFVRELLQNSLDANATDIGVELETVNGHGRVTFTDNGNGMSRDTLENVFFALGRTTKTGDDTIGGFGRARIVICFAQTRYQIRTGNLLVNGSGGDYTVREVDQVQEGCVFTVDTIDGDTDAIRQALRRVLRESSLNAAITVDDQVEWAEPPPGRATKLFREDNGALWARVYVTRGIGSMTIRVRGLAMATSWVPSNDNVIVELVPAASRRVLSASRDRLLPEYDSQIREFVANLSSNRKAAMSDDREPLYITSRGGGMLTAGERPTVPVHAAGEARVAAYAPAVSLPTPSTYNATRTSTAVDGGWHSLGFDVYLIAEEKDARTRKLVRLYDPSRWMDGAAGRRRKLLAAWRAAVNYSLNVALKLHPTAGPVNWTVGWVFDADTAALHRTLPDGGHVIALNPVGDGDTCVYQLSSGESRRKLLARAMHEVVHVLVSGHNETFAGVLTDMIAAVDPADADWRIRNAR